MKFKYLVAAAFVLSAFATDAAFVQQRVKVPITNKEWEQPFPGFKVVGNLYYVGTYDLGCYLIDTGAGLILVNSGAPGSYPLIKSSIEALGTNVLLVEAGFTPLEAIRFATLNGARYQGIDDRVGTLAAGKQADLILVDGKPDEDIRQLRQIDLVFRDGIAYDSKKIVESLRGKIGR